MKIALVDYRIDEIERYNLNALGFQVIKCPPCNQLYDAICGHPDILVHFIDKKNLIVHKDIDKDFIKLLKKYGLKILFSENSLSNNYPGDIFLNALNMKNLFVHNLPFTDKMLLKQVKNKTLIHVKQGYTKCSTVIVNDNAIITSDKSIFEALENQALDILFLPPGDILLPGLNYGFIGGTCGLLNDKQIAFYGNLDYYMYGNEVKNFLYKHNIEPLFLRNGKLVDRGSLLIIDNN